MNSSRAGMLQYMNAVNPEFYQKIKNFENLSLIQFDQVVKDYKQEVVRNDGRKWPYVYYSAKMFLAIYGYLLS